MTPRLRIGTEKSMEEPPEFFSCDERKGFYVHSDPMKHAFFAMCDRFMDEYKAAQAERGIKVVHPQMVESIMKGIVPDLSGGTDGDPNAWLTLILWLCPRDWFVNCSSGRNNHRSCVGLIVGRTMRSKVIAEGQTATDSLLNLLHRMMQVRPVVKWMWDRVTDGSEGPELPRELRVCLNQRRISTHAWQMMPGGGGR